MGRHHDFDQSFQALEKESAKGSDCMEYPSTHCMEDQPAQARNHGGRFPFASGDFTKRDVYDLNFTTKEPITALRIEAMTDERLPDLGPGRAYYEGRKGLFFLSEIDVLLNDGQKVEIQKPLQAVGTVQTKR